MSSNDIPRGFIGRAGNRINKVNALRHATLACLFTAALALYPSTAYAQRPNPPTETAYINTLGGIVQDSGRGISLAPVPLSTPTPSPTRVTGLEEIVSQAYDGPTVTVNVTDLTKRASYSASSASLGTLPKGQELYPDSYRFDGAYTWLHVKENNEEYWIAGKNGNTNYVTGLEAALAAIPNLQTSPATASASPGYTNTPSPMKSASQEAAGLTNSQQQATVNGLTVKVINESNYTPREWPDASKIAAALTREIPDTPTKIQKAFNEGYFIACNARKWDGIFKVVISNKVNSGVYQVDGIACPHYIEISGEKTSIGEGVVDLLVSHELAHVSMMLLRGGEAAADELVVADYELPYKGLTTNSASKTAKVSPTPGAGLADIVSQAYDGPTVTVNVTDLTKRASYSASSASLGTLPKGQELYPDSYRIDNNYTWLHIKANSEEFWLAAKNGNTNYVTGLEAVLAIVPNLDKNASPTAVALPIYSEPAASPTNSPTKTAPLPTKTSPSPTATPDNATASYSGPVILSLLDSPKKTAPSQTAAPTKSNDPSARYTGPVVLSWAASPTRAETSPSSQPPPTRTVTPYASPTPTVQATSPLGKNQVKVAIDDLKLRSGPGIESKEIRTLNNGEVRTIDWYVQNAGYCWLCNSDGCFAGGVVNGASHVQGGLEALLKDLPEKPAPTMVAVPTKSVPANTPTKVAAADVDATSLTAFMKQYPQAAIVMQGVNALGRPYSLATAMWNTSNPPPSTATSCAAWTNYVTTRTGILTGDKCLGFSVTAYVPTLLNAAKCSNFTVVDGLSSTRPNIKSSPPNYSKLNMGDVLFFDYTYLQSKLTHVGIYLGPVVEGSSKHYFMHSGSPSKIQALEDYAAFSTGGGIYWTRYAGAKRMVSASTAAASHELVIEMFKETGIADALKKNGSYATARSLTELYNAVK